MRIRSLVLGVLACAVLACGGVPKAGEDQVLVVFNAGSLARPIRAALDTFAAHTGVRVEQESAGSLESARKLGLILDHESSERRFHYAMRYYEAVSYTHLTLPTIYSV